MATEWTLETVDIRYVKKFDTYLHSFRVRFKVKTKVVVRNEYLLELLENKFNKVKQVVGFVEGDKIRIIAQNPIIRFLRCFCHIIEEIVTSNKHINLGETDFDIQFFKIPRSTEQSRIFNLRKNRHTKRIITQINK